MSFNWVSFVRSIVKGRENCFLTAAIHTNDSSITGFLRTKNGDMLSSHFWWMAPLEFFSLFHNPTIKSHRHSDLNAHVQKEGWQLFCVLIFKTRPSSGKQRSFFTCRLLATRMQRRELFFFTNGLTFSLGFMASVTCFIGFFMGRFQLEKGWISERHTQDAILKTHLV